MSILASIVERIRVRATQSSIYSQSLFIYFCETRADAAQLCRASIWPSQMPRNNLNII